VIDRLLELQGWLDWLVLLGGVIGGALIGGYLLGRALPIRFAVAIFAAGTAIIALLAYRSYQHHVDYCEGSPEVEAGGDKFSCLEPQHWFAFQLELMVLLLAQLGLAVLLVGGLLQWWKRRRLGEGRALIQRT
jgi:hypothetical protein